MNTGSGMESIDVTEAARRQREDPDGPLLVDVREQHEFDEVRAPGAVLIRCRVLRHGSGNYRLTGP